MENQEALYREQIEQLKDYALFFTDVNGVIKTWNAGVEHLFGYSEGEWINQHASIIFTPADQAVTLYEAEMRIAREQGTASDIRWHRKKDGTELFANGVLSAVLDSAGHLQGFTKIISDETARKQLEDSLLAANTALEQFAYAASHDLQEPLRSIAIYAQLLLREEREQLSSAGTEYLAFITSSAAKMNTLIQDLLIYARAGVANTPPAPAPLDQDVEAALSQLAGVIQETGARVTHDPLPVITAERHQTTRLFVNLISNAIKYRSPERAPTIHISAKPIDDRWTTISLADNGIGFAPEHAEKIFDPFTRLHGPEYSGSGVGLAICRRIVENWGGRIWAKSRPGEGSIFHFTVLRS
ncbi:MAG TPA: ATP-binding protein [Bryobacteraceae bacterium]|jgi:PAS domain S-box-containing protein|nr:ATP-binding protein [Bryobacteraceae bacterium]